MAKKVASTLPYNADAERMVLGAALISKEAFYDVIASLKEDDFYEGRHQVIFRALINLETKKIVPEVGTLTEELINMKELEDIGGVDYLRLCCDSMVALSSLNFYINIVRDQSCLRKMLTAIREIETTYQTETIDDVNKFVQDSEAKFKESIAERRVSDFKTSLEVGAEVQAQLQFKRDHGIDDITGLSTGYDNLDAITQGFQKGEYNIIAARPNLGKTSLALNFALNAAQKKRIPVAIFTLEMQNVKLYQRLLGAISSIPLSTIDKGVFTPTQRSSISEAMNAINECKIFLDESSRNSVMDIVSKTRQLQAKEPNLGLVIIDYIGLIDTDSKTKGRNSDSRPEAIRKVSAQLKGMAKDLNIPVVCLCQLSRDVEKRDNKRPMMSDLRDSGGLEQDADVIMLLSRSDYYANQGESKVANKKIANMTPSEKFEMLKQEKFKEMFGQNSRYSRASLLEINVCKNRNGGTGMCSLFFFREIGKFEQPSKEFEEAMQKALDFEAD